MKVEITVNNLVNKLQFLNHAISTKSQLPILLNLLIETRDGKLRISATDLEIGIETNIAATIVEEGSITVPARTFTELIGSLSDTTVTLQTSENTLDVISKKSKSVFQTVPATDFPKLYDGKGEGVARLNDKELRSNLSSVVFSASADTTRPALSGVLVRPEEGGFLLVATNGFRLSLQHYKASKIAANANSQKSFIVPARVFKELLSIKEEVREVEMYVAEASNQVCFKQGETLLIGRLIEAEFPNFEKIIPTDFSLSVIFDREEMLDAVKICSIFARDSANIVKFHLEKDHITVSSQSPSVGENTVDVDAHLTGEENEIAFNAKYLLDLLNNLTEDSLTFEMIGPLNPGVFRIKGDDSFLHLIMPIRTG
jgi:DNA polymerase-3 subunit beta